MRDHFEIVIESTSDNRARTAWRLRFDYRCLYKMRIPTVSSSLSKGKEVRRWKGEERRGKCSCRKEIDSIPVVLSILITT